MKYIIQKTLQGKFKYWLDGKGEWNGLKGSAHCFSEEAYTNRLVEQHQKKDGMALIEVIKVGFQ